MKLLKTINLLLNPGISLVENMNILSALTGGALIGISVTLLLLFNWRISGIMNGLFNSPKNESIWRFTFLSGLIIGTITFQIAAPDLFKPCQNFT